MPTKLATFTGIVVAMALVAMVFVSYANNRALAGQTYSAPVLTNSFVSHTFLSATTTSATSTNAANSNDHLVRLDGANKATFYFSRTGNNGNAGASKFEVEVSADGATWHDVSRLFLSDTAKTASSTVWVTGTTTVMASLDLLDNAFHFARCQVVEVTDGEHTCAVSVEY